MLVTDITGNKKTIVI